MIPMTNGTRACRLSQNESQPRSVTRRILLIISSLQAGGAERVISILANYWADQGCAVTLMTLSSRDSDWYKVDPRVHRVGLGLLSHSAGIVEAFRNSIWRLVCIRRQIRLVRPHAIVSFTDKTNVLTLLAGLGSGVPVIISERVDPRMLPIGSPWKELRSLLYRKADAIVMQSLELREWARNFVSDTAVHVIPNPVNPTITKSKAARQPSSDPSIIAMGRLTRQKGFDLLLEAFRQCREDHPEWSLVVIGEGEERSRLEALSIELGLKDHVRFPGLVQHPWKIFAQSDLFVLSSRFEGFPNVLLEAMACGLAVIATDCPSGPREIIRDGVDGVLVAPDDPKALAAAIDRLMEDDDEGRIGTESSPSSPTKESLRPKAH